MTENKQFTIDVETENYENAYFENDKFLCYEDDYDAILNRLNGLAEENIKQQTQIKKVLKKQLDYYTERALLLKQPYGDVTEAIHNIADELGVDLE